VTHRESKEGLLLKEISTRVKKDFHLEIKFSPKEKEASGHNNNRYDTRT
jgi:hypothetical protein